MPDHIPRGASRVERIKVTVEQDKAARRIITDVNAPLEGVPPAAEKDKE